MDLIVTHTAGDFDSLASLVAAKKIYPRADIILPQSPGKQVRFFLSIYQNFFNLKDERFFDFNKVKRLIIVDTKLKSRLGRAASVLDNKEVEVHIYDHHPSTLEDIKAKKEVSRHIGATVTILIDEIKKRKISITPLEATVMALGIYEDTGSLTFRTTTKKDIEAVSYLFSRGANLNIVSHYLNRQLTEEELSLLVKLIQGTRTYSVNGIAIAISSIVHLEYIPDLALITHRLIDIENFNVIFVLVKINSKIQMVARSSLSSVDVNKIASFFGGGGHASASSCLIKGDNLKDAKDKILELLKNKIKPELTAKDIMRIPVKTAAPSQSINEVKSAMIKFNTTGMPIVSKGKIIGIITRGDLDKAIYHGFGHSKIKGYMSAKIISVSEKASFSAIHKIAFENNIGHLPVINNNKIIGIITRDEILNVMHKKLGYGLKLSSSSSSSSLRKDNKLILKKETGVNLAKKMKKNLPPKIFKILKDISKIADEYNFRVYTVGGFIRDLILGYKNLDIDLTVEGDALEFARIYSEKFKTKLVTHARFGTAVIILSGGVKIDVASSRTEFYEHPAALPTVELSVIKNDLLRRDFSINAIAAGLNKDNFGEVIDFFRGQKDIARKRIRVLHNLSFIEDPTRIFRAVRFEQRYNFKIDKRTEHLIKTAVRLNMFKKIAGERMRNEIIPILSEKEPLKGVKRMNQLHELRFIHKGLILTQNSIKYFKNITKSLKWLNQNLKISGKPWLIYFFALSDNLNSRQVKSIYRRLVFSRKDAEQLITYKKDGASVLMSLKSLSYRTPSDIYKLLNPYSYEFLVMLLSKSASQTARVRIKKFLNVYKQVTLKITGEDLKKAGFTPSPEFKDILDDLLYAKLDKELKNKKDELNHLKRLIKGKYKNLYLKKPQNRNS